MGLLTLALFAFLMASYLTVEATDDRRRDLFRRRAPQSQVALWVFAATTLVIARAENPLLFQVARLAAAAQARFILWG